MAQAAGPIIHLSPRASAIRLRPIVAEIVRTGICPEKPILLVDRISILHSTAKSIDGRPQQTYRLWLSDGKQSIQGILKYELHPFVAAGHISEGSYVELIKCCVGTAKRVTSDDTINILQIDDLEAIGHDGRAPKAPHLPAEESARDVSPEMTVAAPPPAGTPSKSFHLPADSPGRLSQMLRESQQSQNGPKSLRNGPSPHSTPRVPSRRTWDVFAEETEVKMPDSPTRPKRKREPTCSPLDAISNNSILPPAKVARIDTTATPELAAKEAMTTGAEMAAALEATDKVEQMARAEIAAKIATTAGSGVTTTTATTTPMVHPPSPVKASKPPLVVTEKEISRPLAITPLAKIIGPRTIRNRIHDVLAVICSVDAEVIRRRGMPEQRNLRITDQSTTKHVQLTVFVNAAEFQPAVGTVALLRNVTTHEWNGGSLKAYQRDCAGVQWFFPEPTHVDAKLVQLVKHCWETRKLAGTV